MIFGKRLFVPSVAFSFVKRRTTTTTEQTRTATRFLTSYSPACFWGGGRGIGNTDDRIHSNNNNSKYQPRQHQHQHQHYGTLLLLRQQQRQQFRWMSNGSIHHHGTTHTINIRDSSSSSSSIILKEEEDSNHEVATTNNNCNDFGNKLRELLLNDNNSSSSSFSSDNLDDDSIALWKEAEDILRSSLQEIRILRSRIERHKIMQRRDNYYGCNDNYYDDNINNNNENDIHATSLIIRDCIRLLDRLAYALPPAEEYSSWLLLYGSTTNGHINREYEETATATATTISVLETKLLNELLKEWLLARKNEQQQQQQKQKTIGNGSSLPQQRDNRAPADNNKQQFRLPTPAKMADKIDHYRSCMLLQPNPTTFNTLLNAMINNNNNNNHNSQQLLNGIKLADDYLRRLLQVQQQQNSQSSTSASSSYVDVISFTTVMKGWVTCNQPNKAQEWFDQMIMMSQAKIPHIPHPNAISYSTIIHGWAKVGDVRKAESLLLLSIQDQLNHDNGVGVGNDDNDGGDRIIVDRVVFHTVIDAWAAKAAAATSTTATASTTSPKKIMSKTQIKRMKKKQKQYENNKEDTQQQQQQQQQKEEENTLDDTTAIIIPALRAKEIVDTMEDLANNYSHLDEYIRPNNETWYKLICAIASQQKPSLQQNNDDPCLSSPEELEYGPNVAEEMLNRIEENNGILATPAVVLNRILRAYTISTITTMSDAEDFYHRRIQQQKESEQEEKDNENDIDNDDYHNMAVEASSTFPNEITFNTILTGLANTASDYYSIQNKNNDDNATTATKRILLPHNRAELWLDEMYQYGINPSTRSYSSVLQVYSCAAAAAASNNSSSYFGDDDGSPPIIAATTDAAAHMDRAEEILKRYILSDLEKFFTTTTTSSSNNENDSAVGITICTNIVLRAWSNLTSPPPKKKKKMKKGIYKNTVDADNDSTIISKEESRRNHDRLILGRRAVGRCIRLLDDYLFTIEDETNSNKFNIKPTLVTFRPVLYALISPNSTNTMQLTEKCQIAHRLFVDAMNEKYRLYFTKEDRKKLDRLFLSKKNMMTRKKEQKTKKGMNRTENNNK